METKLEQAIQEIRSSSRKGSKSAAWACANRAAEIAGVEAYSDESGRWPDLERLEKDVRAALDDRPVIVTRHGGVVEWLVGQGIYGKIISHATPDDVRGKVVYGNLPLFLAAEAARVVTVELPDLKPEQRGEDLDPSEMDAAGARLRTYQVREV